jgi:hypothetical protein
VEHSRKDKTFLSWAGAKLDFFYTLKHYAKLPAYFYSTDGQTCMVQGNIFIFHA